MTELKSKMEKRQKDSYFGFETACKLEYLHPHLKRECILDFYNFYDRALNYISKRYKGKFSCKKCQVEFKRWSNIC